MKSIVIAAVLLFALVPYVRAEEGTLGDGTFGIKVEAISFKDSEVENNDLDKGVYIAFEGYARMGPKIYFGGEVGYAHPDGSVGGTRTELTYMPFEFNVKYSDEAAPNTVISAGGGLAYIYVEETSGTGGGASTTNDWLLGGQFFADLLYTSGSFFAGVDLKYQFTENFDRTAPGGGSYGYSNWRVGGLAGVMF